MTSSIQQWYYGTTTGDDWATLFTPNDQLTADAVKGVMTHGQLMLDQANVKFGCGLSTCGGEGRAVCNFLMGGAKKGLGTPLGKPSIDEGECAVYVNGKMTQGQGIVPAGTKP